ncbi:MAG: HEAT repeat domain-containing protein [Anaerolineae bacterium]|nr:HEAT repeat domain-containing protein [Anaerolineae bacterium]
MPDAPPAEIEPLLAQLYSADAREAGERLVALGSAAVEPLIAVLNGQHPLPDMRLYGGIGSVPDSAAARERAAYLLGDIGDARAVEPLIAAYARETSRYTRLAIARALGKIGDGRAAPTLVALLDDIPFTPDYAHIVDDYARIAGANAVEPLLRVVRSRRYSYGGAAHAVRALARLRADPRVLPGLIDALRTDAETATVLALIDTLAETSDARAIDALIGFIGVMIQLPPERWDERDENRSETDAGVVFHILKAPFRAAAAAVRKTGSAEARARLEHLLGSAPAYVSGSDSSPLR